MKKQKDKTYAFRVSSAELNKIKALAKRANMTVTAYLTTCALNKKITIITGLDEWLAEMKAQGRNLNQFVTRMHMGQSDPGLAERLIQKYGDLCVELRRIGEAE